MGGKVVVVVVGVLTFIVGSVAMLVSAFYLEGEQWKQLGCGSRMTTDSPFSEEAVCEEIEQATLDHYGEPRPAYVRVLPTEGQHISSHAGGDRTGEMRGQWDVVFGYREGQRLCRTAFRHEVRHVLFRQDGRSDGDRWHLMPDWQLYDGCPEERGIPRRTRLQDIRSQ